MCSLARPRRPVKHTRATIRRVPDEETAPLDCDGRLLDLLGRVTIFAATLDFAWWKLARKAGDKRVPANYTAPELVQEARRFMRQFDMDALERGLEADRRAKEAARAN